MLKALVLAMMMQAGEVPVPAPAVAPLPHVEVVTGLGAFTLRLERDKAPLTTANFLRYVDQKRFDGTVFYRAMMVGDAGQFGLIQGGTQGNSKRVLPPVKHEPTSITGLSNTDMVISMARGAPGSANGDFFIILGDLSSLDANASDPGFAAFGKVVAGQSVVKAIQAAPVSATKGEGAMQGQMIEKPVGIVRMRRTLPVVEVVAPPAVEPVFAPAVIGEIRGVARQAIGEDGRSAGIIGFGGVLGQVPGFEVEGEDEGDARTVRPFQRQTVREGGIGIVHDNLPDQKSAIRRPKP